MITLVKGFHDILPDDALKWSFITESARSCLRKYGFREIITPIMEKTDLFVRGIGQVTDIVEKEMYTFQDIGGESLSLRPEATAGILRSVIEHSLLRKEPILRFFTIGPMFRRERPSKGRFRQFFQLNAEVLGDDDPFTDSETISCACSILESIGAIDLVVEINSVGCKNCRSIYRDELRNFLKRHYNNLCQDCQRRMETNPLRCLDCKSPTCNEVMESAPVITDYLDKSCQDHFSDVRKGLDILDINYRLQPKMVRGLDYYTRTAFEIIDLELGHSKAVGGGGRYDSLISELGGPDISGIGFAIGLERLIMSLRDSDEKFSRSIDLYVAPLGDETRQTCHKLVKQLRDAGFSVETKNTLSSLKSHMKQADRAGAQKTIMMGSEELARGAVTIRDMVTKDQSQVSLNDIIIFLRGDGD
ncbi:MAG: histidine--tRNA ligase [Syntrophaceae bacterium]|nr:histidine--tRNA ligase [Syntrophaceae bacterium]